MRVNLDLVNDLAAREWPDAVNALVEAPPNPETAPPADKSDATIEWWTRQLTNPTGGLHERMTFFWHTLLTTHRYASGEQKLLSVQLNMLRANAMGNYRQLLQSFAVDGALIKYLNADSNTAKKPNENLARELMELFSTGVGHYSEDDVRAAALGLTGWRVDKDNNSAVIFDPERAHTEPVTFLGETKNWDVASIVDRLCDHPATAVRISSLMWYHFVGAPLGGAEAAELGSWWQQQNLEIKPLITRIFNEGAFRANHYGRPRSGFEYYAALQSIVNFDPGEEWRARNMGQGLYEPPNVAGWPTGDRWLDPDSMLRRSDILFSFDYKDIPEAMTATVDQILDRCGLFVVSQGTLDALNNAGAGQDNFGDEGIANLRWRIAFSSPEFQLT